MGKIKGQNEWEKFKRGEKLSRKQAILALCYECNGFEESNVDCGALLCAIHDWSPFKGKRAKKAILEAQNL